jgi:hypothetical protein
VPGGYTQHQVAYAAVGEAVWWVTMVDATLVRPHREAYDALMSADLAYAGSARCAPDRA